METGSEAPNDKVRQDFEAWGIREHGWVQSALNALWDVDMYRNVEFQKNFVAFKAGRAAERAEIVAKLESEAVAVEAGTAIHDRNHYERLKWEEQGAGGKEFYIRDAKAAITKILEVI